MKVARMIVTDVREITSGLHVLTTESADAKVVSRVSVRGDWPPLLGDVIDISFIRLVEDGTNPKSLWFPTFIRNLREMAGNEPSVSTYEDLCKEDDEETLSYL